MENEWVVLARFADEMTSQVAVDRLMVNDIEAVTIDKRESVYNVDGYIELCVHRDNAIIALEMIKDLVSE